MSKYVPEISWHTVLEVTSYQFSPHCPEQRNQKALTFGGINLRVQ